MCTVLDMHYQGVYCHQGQIPIISDLMILMLCSYDINFDIILMFKNRNLFKFRNKRKVNGSKIYNCMFQE
jgi:hypothetical protein